MNAHKSIDWLRRSLTLPLFAKELAEASARRRTYIARTLYAGTLFLLAIIFTRDVLFVAGDGFSVLGRGGKLFVTIMLLQFGGVYLFLPALTAAAITAEKERNTLGLLLLTKLSPSKIVLEKFLGRVFPMTCLALLSLPLLGVAYSLGGLESGLLVEGIVRLLVTILMIGAIGIACSSWCRTTAGAFLLTYAVLFILFPAPIFVFEAFDLGPGSNTVRAIGRVAVSLKLIPDEPDVVVGIFFGPLPLLLWQDYLDRGMGGGGTFLTRPFWVVLWQSTPLLLVAVASLVAARLSLVTRAEVQPKRYLARAFRALDSRFRALNDRYAKGIEIIKSRGSLPEDRPIAWRETTKTTLGAFRYLVRILLLVEVPVVFIGVIAAGSSSSASSGLLGVLAVFLWLGAALLVAVKGAGLFPSERAKQSLDVLLTTPLSTKNILREKLSGLWRLIGICAIPLMTTFFLIAYMQSSIATTAWSWMFLFLALSASVVLTHLALPAYLSVLIGLKIATQSRAVLTSVTLLVILCLSGPLIRLVITAGNYQYYPTLDPLSLYSPAIIVGEMVEGRLETGELLYLLIGNTIIYGGLAAALRFACYWKAGEWLDRSENESRIPSPRTRTIEAFDEAMPVKVPG